MKTLYLLTFLSFIMVPWSQAKATDPACDTTKIVLKFPHGALNATEKDSIIQILGLEKLSQDIYAKLHEKWPNDIFKSHPLSEEKHSQAVTALLTKYEITNPYTNLSVGIFPEETLTQLYQDWTTRGKISLIEALTVGAQLEEKDIKALEGALVNATLDNFDIQFVYKNLVKGSRNHLRALIQTLKEQGIDEYQPQFLSSEALQNITDSPLERYAYEEINKQNCYPKPDQKVLTEKQKQKAIEWVEQMEQGQKTQKLEVDFEPVSPPLDGEEYHEHEEHEHEEHDDD